MNLPVDKNGIKIYPAPRRTRTSTPTCWKVCYSEETAKRKAAMAHDWKGDYNAYKCPRGNHWHIGHVQ